MLYTSLAMPIEHRPEGSQNPLEQRDPNLPRYGEVGEETLEGQSASGLDRLNDFLREYTSPADRIAFQGVLASSGWLTRLEQAGVLPIVKNLNPFDPDREEQQHEQWWKEHSTEGEKFMRTIDNREKIIGYLYIGALLGRRFA